MKMEVIIPHDADEKNLGAVYNMAMKKADDWVLFMDSDAFLLHPKWYDICIRAIAREGYGAGLMTCYTNRLGCSQQIINRNSGHDILEHTQIAIDVEKENRNQVENYTNGKRMSGHLMLTHRDAWERCGGFAEGVGVIGTDTRYHGAIESAGYKVLLLKDLYVYHRYERYWRLPEWQNGAWCA